MPSKPIKPVKPTVQDPRSSRGIFSRGKPVYNGVSNAPNPTGQNQASAAKRLLEMRRKMSGA